MLSYQVIACSTCITSQVFVLLWRLLLAFSQQEQDGETRLLLPGGRGTNSNIFLLQSNIRTDVTILLWCCCSTSEALIGRCCSLAVMIFDTQTWNISHVWTFMLDIICWNFVPIGGSLLKPTSTIMSVFQAMEVKKIDVSPHAPFGSKAARKLAKDRANERYIIIELFYCQVV